MLKISESTKLEEADFTNLKDESNNSRPVFIRFNKNDLSEKYVCTTYNMTNNEPTCISQSAYATRSNADSEWNMVKALFGESNCTEVSYYASYVNCHIPAVTWYCQSGNNNSYCGFTQNQLVTNCELNNGNVSCSVTIDSDGK